MKRRLPATVLLHEVLCVHWKVQLFVDVLCEVTHSGRGSGTCQLSPSSLVLAAAVLSGFKLSSLGSPLKLPVEATHRTQHRLIRQFAKKDIQAYHLDFTVVDLLTLGFFETTKH